MCFNTSFIFLGEYIFISENGGNVLGPYQMEIHDLSVILLLNIIEN